jgi:hypothetical protein
MNGKTTHMKLKLLLISDDGGATWLAVRQYYAADLRTCAFLDINFQGDRFKLVEEESDVKATT